MKTLVIKYFGIILASLPPFFGSIEQKIFASRQEILPINERMVRSFIIVGALHGIMRAQNENEEQHASIASHSASSKFNYA